MARALAAAIVQGLLGLRLGATAQEDNRLLLEGLAFAPAPDGALEARITRLQLEGLRVSAGPCVLELGRLALRDLTARVNSEGGQPQLASWTAAGAEFLDLALRGPVRLPTPAPAAPAGPAWSLGPLAAAAGTLRGEIVDAMLVFDATVTVPVRHGRVDFGAVSVEHVGPDSRMGASRLGIYLDAPNGRSYLYQFPSAPAVGVDYEQRGALLGPWVSQRGRLHLQPFAEWLLRQGAAGAGPGFTEQARLLLARTAISGELQLGEGPLAAPGLQAELVGRNAVRVHSEAVGRGVTLELPALSVREVAFTVGAVQLRCGQMNGALLLRLLVEGGQLRFEAVATKLELAALHGR